MTLNARMKAARLSSPMLHLGSKCHCAGLRVTHCKLTIAVGDDTGPCSVAQFHTWILRLSQDPQLAVEYQQFKEISVWMVSCSVCSAAQALNTPSVPHCDTPSLFWLCRINVTICMPNGLSLKAFCCVSCSKTCLGGCRLLLCWACIPPLRPEVTTS